MRTASRSAFSPAFSTSVIPTSEGSANKWNVELLLRYAAATLTTWIALAGAQLIVPSSFALTLAVLAFLGVPVSLYLRFHDMRVGSLLVSRPLWNSLTVAGTLMLASFFLWPTISDMLTMWNLHPQSFWLRFGAGDSLGLLMQAFLIFAALRSFAIISDKDATLTTIPSFSVLLLLIPVHQGIEVVFYFLAWTLVATMLFALDHRSELSSGVVARVPSPVPGQDVRLAARSLITVLATSLVAAIGLSVYLTSRNPEDRSEAESAITSLAARLTQFALSLPEGSVNSGPERQIDFSSGPALPSQTELWIAQASTIDKYILRPMYWRLFSLSVYNGNSWSQTTLRQRPVKQTVIDWIPGEFFPYTYSPNDFLRARRRLGASGIPGNSGPGGGFGGWGGMGGSPGGAFGVGRPRGIPGKFVPRDRNLRSDNKQLNNRQRPALNGVGRTPALSAEERRVRDFRGDPSRFNIPLALRPDLPWNTVPGYPDVYSHADNGFEIGKVASFMRQYGAPTELVRVRMNAQVANLGFVPQLPASNLLLFRQGNQSEVRVSFDGAVDMGVMQPSDRAQFTAQVPRLAEYGFRSGAPPQKRVAENATTPKLSAVERTINLQLPPSVTKRTRDLGTRVLLRATGDDNNYSRAQRLALAIRQGAVYTLRPPSTPQGRDATDFFLFDGDRRGYCTYFAGALTVLCRTQNIPARVVSGFASPEYGEDGRAVIRDANAHAWTEVWIENWGWAIVDATPADDRGDNAPTIIESWGDWAGATLDSLSRSVSAHWPLLAVAVVGVLLLIVRWKRFRWVRVSRSDTLSSELQRREIAAQYERMSLLLARHFRPRASWETPDEWLLAAQTTLPRLPSEALNQLTQLYLQSQFSPHPLAQTAAAQAQEAVQNVRHFQWRQKTVMPPLSGN